MEEELLNQQKQEQQVRQNEEESIKMTPSMKETLEKTSSWSKFLAIISFIASGLMLIFVINVGINGISGVKNIAFRMLMALIYTAIAGIYFWIGKYIWNFYKGLNGGIQENNQESYENGFNSLKNLFQIIGVLAVIGLVFFVISMIMMFFVSSMIDNQPF